MLFFYAHPDYGELFLLKPFQILGIQLRLTAPQQVIRLFFNKIQIAA